MSEFIGVTRVSQHSEDRGLAVEITVTRSFLYPSGLMPRVEDVPQDIRDALRRWLDGER